MASIPVKVNIDVLFLMCHPDVPESFWDEVLDTEIAANNKAESWKLA
jgi:hypothetical protein